MRNLIRLLKIIMCLSVVWNGYLFCVAGEAGRLYIGLTCPLVVALGYLILFVHKQGLLTN